MAKTEGAPHATIATRRLCGAKCRQRNYQPCRQAAMANGRCRLHGGKSTGPKTEIGKNRAASANWKHGRYTKAAIEERKRLRLMMAWRKDFREI